MSTTNLPTTAPGSTSTPAPRSTPATSEPAAPLQLRAIAPTLVAKHPIDGRGLMLPSGQVVFPQSSDYVITRDGQIVDVCDATELTKRYQIISDGLTLPRTLCTRLEEITGVGTTRTAEALLKAVDRLAHIAIGEVQLRFTPGQLEEIKHRAEKRGRTVAQEIATVVDRIKDELFYGSTTPRG